MRRAVVGAISLALLGPVSAVSAQAPDPQSDPPVSMARIKRALQQPHRELSLDELRLAYFVSVTADAPPANLFKDFDWKHGPVPGSPPSHREMLQHLTPQEFSAPAADFTWLGRWLASKVAHKNTGT